MNRPQAQRLEDYTVVELEHGPDALVRRVAEDLGLKGDNETMLILTTMIWVAHKAIVREGLDVDLDDDGLDENLVGEPEEDRGYQGVQS
jgi:hypothetical protein